MSNASQIQKQQIERLIKDLQNQSPEIRLAAAETLGEIGAETAVPILHQLLESESKEVRVNTILALGAFSTGGTPNIDPTLIGILQDPSQDEDICRSTVEALASIGQDAVLALVHTLRSKTLSTRGYAAVGLGIIGKDAVPVLIKLLSSQAVSYSLLTLPTISSV